MLSIADVKEYGDQKPFSTSTAVVSELKGRGAAGAWRRPLGSGIWSI